jgi:hypothetical protein
MRQTDPVMTPGISETFAQIRQRPWNSRFFALPDWHRRYPTMLTREEMRMLAWLAQHLAVAGDIADLGCFLGGSSVSLAHGVVQSKAERRVFSYDRFAIDERLKFQFLYQRGHGFYPDTDTLPLFAKLTRGFAGTITAVQGDIRAQAWPAGPIALLFVDLSKTTEINDHILTHFFTALEPGSIVVQQDFLYFSNPWLYPTMRRLEGAIEMLAHTEDHSVIFGVRRKPTADEIETCLARNVAPEDVLAAIAHFRGRFHDVRQVEMIDALEAAVKATPHADKAWQLGNAAKIPMSFVED